MECPNCAALIRDEDYYCCFCGRLTIKIGFDITKGGIIQSPEIYVYRDVENDLNLRFNRNTTAPLDISIMVDPPDVFDLYESKFRFISTSKDIRFGWTTEFLEYNRDIDFAVNVQAKVMQLNKTTDFKIRIFNKPELNVIQFPIRYFKQSEDYQAKIVLSCDTPCKVDHIAISPAEFSIKSPGQTTGFWFPVKDNLSLEIQASEKLLKSEEWLKLEFFIEGVGKIEKDFPIVRLGKIHSDDKMIDIFDQMGEKRVVFWIKNESGEMNITDIRTPNPDLIKVDKSVKFPIKLDDKSKPYGIALLIREPRDLKVGDSIETRLEFWDNDFQVGMLPIYVHRLERQIYQGPVAIDYGTTNSCCALFDEKLNAPRVVLWEDQKYIPSAIRYEKRISKNEWEYQIGPNVLIDLSIRPQALNNQIFTSVKRYLGSEKTLTIRSLNEIHRVTPDYIVTDILKALWSTAAGSDELGRFRVNRWILTHPCVYSRRHILKYKAAAKDALKCEESAIQMIDEPSAAAIYHILCRDSAIGNALIESLIVLDCGGGTTDIALLDTWYETSNGEDHLKIAKRGICGLRDFHGDYLTEQMLELIVSKIEEKVNERVKYYRDETDDITDLCSVSNKGTLLDIAEQAKRDISKSDTLLIKNEDLTKLYDLSDGYFTLDDFGEDMIAITVGEFEARISEKLDNICDEIMQLINRFGSKTSNYGLLLTGQSSQMKIIQTRLKRIFGSSMPIFESRENNWKECVALGASHYGYISKLAGLKIELIDFDTKIWGSIGQMGVNRTGQLIACELVRQGSDISNRCPVKLNKPNTQIELIEYYSAKDAIVLDLKNENVMFAKKLNPPKIQPHLFADATYFIEFDQNGEIGVVMIADGKEYNYVPAN
jgi:hypothetical protein